MTAAYDKDLMEARVFAISRGLCAINRTGRPAEAVDIDLQRANALVILDILDPLINSAAAPPSEIAPLFVAYRLSESKPGDLLSSNILEGLVERLRKRPEPEDPSDWRIEKYLVRNGEVQYQVLAEDEYSEPAFTRRWKDF